jgi:hypothetical protein
MLYAVMSTYAIILTFAPYYSSYIEISYYEDSIKQAVTIYKQNFTDAYEVLMHGKSTKEVNQNEDIKDPFSYYNDKKSYNLGPESETKSWFNNDYFKTILVLGITAVSGYVLYYYGHDIYDYIISNFINRDPGNNPDGSRTFTSSNPTDFPMGSGFINTFTENNLKPIYRTYETFLPKPHERLARSYGEQVLDVGKISPYSVESPDATPRPSTSKLPTVESSLENNSDFNPDFE